MNTVLGEVARRSTLWLVADALLLAYGLWSGHSLLVFAALALLVYPFARAAWGHRHADRYQELLKVFALGDWARVERLAGQLRRSGVKSTQLAFDLDVRSASIRARNGELGGAERDLEPWREKLAASRGFFESRLASVHAAAGDREGFVRLMEQAYEASGRDPARALDYALANARYADPSRAESLLAELDPSLLPPHAAGFLLWARGLVALRRGGTDGLELLGQATAEFLKLAANPAVWTALAFCACDHAIALDQGGRKDDARRQLGQVWPIVSAHADKQQLRFLEAAGLIQDGNKALRH